jgi:hypothetical protein
MKPYRLNLKAIIGVVGLISLLIFSAVIIVLHIEPNPEHLGETLLHYGIIIAPVGILWFLLDQYLWSTWLFQMMRKSFNIPPVMKGRWEGILENADGSAQQRFVIEVKQTLSGITVHSYSSIGHSKSILTEIAADAHEEHFMLGYLWQGEMNTSIKDMHQGGGGFYGYTMLYLDEKESPKVLKGTYFTNLRPTQTRGGIHLEWVSKELKRKF